MIYVAIIRSEEKPGRVELATSMTKLSEITGIRLGTLRYQFGKKKRVYYEHHNPWIEVFVADRVTRQKRPQYNRL